MVITRRCEVCGLDFEAARATARYCSPEHRQQAYAARRKARQQEIDNLLGSGLTGDGSAAGGVGRRGLIEAATRAQLAAVRLDVTALGLAAVAAARRLDQAADSIEPGSGFAAIAKLHAAALMRAMETAAPASAPVGPRPPGSDELDARRDELARKREQRRAGGR